MVYGTLILRQILQIYLHREIVAALRGDNVGSIFALEDGLSSVLDELREALDGYRDENLGLGLRGGDVKGHAVEVRHHLVNRDCRPSASCELLVRWSYPAIRQAAGYGKQRTQRSGP